MLAVQKTAVLRNREKTLETKSNISWELKTAALEKRNNPISTHTIACYGRTANLVA